MGITKFVPLDFLNNSDTCAYIPVLRQRLCVLSRATRVIPEISVLTSGRGKKRLPPFYVAVKGKNSVQWASKWQNKTAGGGRAGNCTGLGVNNGDVTAGRRMTERQDNGLLSLFSVLAPPPLALPRSCWPGEEISLLVLPHDFFDSGQTKGRPPRGRPPGGIFEDRRIARFIPRET